ncbi:MAG: hypothetical protein U5O39_13730 [Gammaproteobacteria bacterium]|nr:hypothetical protein [Gammaproteobacteria bacterium]
MPIDSKTFDPLSEHTVAKLPGHMGVFELASDDGKVLFIGMAGGRSRFGLRSEIGACLGSTTASRFRCEVTTSYLTRYQELLMRFVAAHGRLPAENDAASVGRLGRLSPG